MSSSQESPLSEEDQAEIVVRYRQGASARGLAERFGTSRMSILRALDRAGVERRPQHWPVLYPEDLTDTILYLRDREQLSWAAIAEEVGMKPSGVRRRYDTARRVTTM